MPSLSKHAKWLTQYKQAMHMLSNNGVVALLGPRGTGKTQLAVEIIRRFCANSMPDKPMSCVYTVADELFPHIRSSYDSAGKLTEHAAVAKYFRPKLLVIDELQEIKGSGFELQKLTLIVDKRYGALKPTILIANLEPKEFYDRVGSSIQSRMDEGGGHLEFLWPSFRKHKQE